MRTEEEVLILIEARDEATKAIGNVAGSLGDLATPAKGLTGILGGVSGALGTAIGTFTGGAALDLAAKGFSALTGFIGDGVAGAKEAAAGYAQLTAVLASTGGAVGLTADELANLSGDLSQAKGVSTFADDQILSLENLLLTFTNIGGDIFKQATSIGVDMATALGTEPSAAAVQLGKALNDPIAGVGALSRVGVTFTEQQKEQIKVMQESGDMAGAQSVILAELTKEFGGSAQAAADAAGPQAQFAEQMGELSETIGAALLPLMQEFFGLLTSPAVMGAITGLVDAVVNGLGAGFAWLSETAIPALISGWQALQPAISALKQEIAGFIESWDNIVAAFQDGGLLGALQESMLAIQAYGGRILGWLKEQVPIWAGQLAAWGEAFIGWIAPMIPPLLAKAADLARQFIGWIGDQAAPILAKLGEWAASLVAWIVPATKDFLAKWPIMFDQFLSWIGEMAGPLLKKLGDWAVSLIAWILPMIPPFLLALGGIAAALLIWVAETAVVLLKKIVTEWVPAFINWIKDSVIPKLGPALKSMLDTIGAWITGTAVPWAAQALASLGKAMIDGMLAGVKSNWDRLASWILGQLRHIPGFDLFFGGGGGTPGGQSAAFGVPAGPAVAGVSTRAFGAAPSGITRGGFGGAAAVLTINVDARGAESPLAVEEAGYRGVMRALNEAKQRGGGRQSADNLRRALEGLARAG